MRRRACSAYRRVVDLLARARADIGRPDHVMGRGEAWFLVLFGASIVVEAQVVEPGSAADVVLLAFAVVALAGIAAVPRVPPELFGVAVIVPVTVVVGREGNLELSFFLINVMTTFAGWRLGSTIRTAAVALAGVAGIVTASAITPDGFSPMPWLVAQVMVFVLGRNLHRQEVLIAELNVARRAIADHEVMVERQRIAREVHDLAGHTITAMVLSVTSARHVLRRDLDEAERALVDAEGVGRSGMDRIRATVSGLRHTERGTDPPVPETVDVASIVAEYENLGLRINCSIDDRVVRAGGPIAAALDRITREALANVARHAPDNAVELRVEHVDGPAVRLTVRDRGRTPTAATSAGTFGLVGMEERARSLGGRFSAGPTDDGWIVEAIVPLDENARVAEAAS